MLPYIAAREAEVKRKHPEIREEWVAAVLEHPHHTETQDDGQSSIMVILRKPANGCWG